MTIEQDLLNRYQVLLKLSKGNPYQPLWEWKKELKEKISELEVKLNNN